MASLIPGWINVVITNDYCLDNAVMHDLLCQQQVILLYFLYLLFVFSRQLKVCNITKPTTKSNTLISTLYELAQRYLFKCLSKTKER